MLGKFIGWLIGGAPGSAIGAGLDAAEKKLTESVLKQVETHALPHLGPKAKCDLGTTLRLAHLAACLVVLETLSAREEADAAAQRSRGPDGFVGAARLRLHTRLGAASEAAEGEPAELRAALDGLGTADLATPRQAPADLVRGAEDAAWTDLCALLGGLTAPGDFEGLFRGTAADGIGWVAGFIAFFRHHLGTNPRAETAFVAQSLALLRQGDARLDVAFGTLAAQVARAEEAAERRDAATQAKLDELLALARQGGAIGRAAEAGIPEIAVRRIVERLGAEGLGRDDLLPWLDAWIESAREQLARHVNEDRAFEAAMAEANRRFRAGRGDIASAALMAEFAREEQAERERQEERQRRRVRLLEEAIRYDELALQPEAAVEKLRRMAELQGAAGADTVGTWLFEHAAEFFARGETKGQNAALLVAIAAFRAALEELTRDRVPFDWATTQNNLGTALATLGGRESGTARLEQAVEAYRAALEERTRERVPLDWATTQSNLGNALATLGERESGTARLLEAVAAYHNALEELRRNRVPLLWAATQNNLGGALQALGTRESGTARLADAVAAYRATLEEWTHDRVPRQWALTQNNLGTALQTLGAREGGTARLEEAVAAYRFALEERTRERAPLDWAATQNNLGNALQALGAHDSGTALLADAVVAYRAALEERTRERVPLDWAITQNNLGTALARLGARERGGPHLAEAIVAYRAALKESTRERVPLLWAQTTENLAIAEDMLGDESDDASYWLSALDHVEAALEEYRAAGANYFIAKATRLRDGLAAKIAAAT